MTALTTVADVVLVVGVSQQMLDSLLDKTAMYSQFVSSNIKTAEPGATRSGAKRAAAPAKAGGKKRAKKDAKEKFDLDNIEGEDADAKCVLCHHRPDTRT